jgi:hypothetical protein
MMAAGDIGTVPQWITALVSLAVYWKARNAAKEISLVHHETNSMRAALEVAKKAEGNLEGRKELRGEQNEAIVAAEESGGAVKT